MCGLCSLDPAVKQKEIERIKLLLLDLDRIMTYHECLLEGTEKPHTDEAVLINITIDRVANHFHSDWNVTIIEDDPYEHRTTDNAPEDGSSTDSIDSEDDPF